MLGIGLQKTLIYSIRFHLTTRFSDTVNNAELKYQTTHALPFQLK